MNATDTPGSIPEPPRCKGLGGRESGKHLINAAGQCQWCKMMGEQLRIEELEYLLAAERRRAETAEEEVESLSVKYEGVLSEQRDLLERLTRIEAETVERCAKIAENHFKRIGKKGWAGIVIAATIRKIAAAIRHSIAKEKQ